MRRTAPGSARSRSAGGRTVRESDARSPAGPRPREKLKKLQAEADAGLKTSASYTLVKAVDDWGAEALDGLADKTVRSHVDLLRPVTMLIGNVPLRDLTAQDVRRTPSKLAQTRSTRTMASTHNVLVRAIRHAEANDHVGRNVASLVKPPQGRAGRYGKPVNVNGVILAGIYHPAPCGPGFLFQLPTGAVQSSGRDRLPAYPGSSGTSWRARVCG